MPSGIPFRIWHLCSTRSAILPFYLAYFLAVVWHIFGISLSILQALFAAFCIAYLLAVLAHSDREPRFRSGVARSDRRGDCGRTDMLPKNLPRKGKTKRQKEEDSKNEIKRMACHGETTHDIIPIASLQKKKFHS